MDKNIILGNSNTSQARKKKKINYTWYVAITGTILETGKNNKNKKSEQKNYF